MAISRMRRRLLLHKNTISQQPNTFIGNVGATIVTSASDLAGLTSLSASNISNFSIDSNNNVSCYINANYTVDIDGFNDNDITYFIDFDGKCTGVNNRSFRTNSNKVVILPNVTSSTTSGFQGISTFDKANWDVISIPLLTPIGTSATNQSNFTSCDIQHLYTNSANATNNGGSPDGDLTELTANITNLNYSTNTNSPDAVDDLSVSDYGGTSIHVEWTAPTSTNTVDFYLIFANNAYVGFTQLTTYTVTLLDFNTSYDIRVVALDEMGNISPFSNTVSQTTLSDYDIPVGNIVSYWNFNSNSNDQVGSNNGTDTSMSYVASGGIGNVADFTAGNTSAITIPDADNLSFGNGTTDSPFSGVIRVKFNTVGNAWFINKRRLSPNQATLEYQFYYFSNSLTIAFTDINNIGNLITSYAWTPVAGVWYEIGWSYDGSNQPKLFLNGQKVGSANNTGTYVSMSNTVSPLVFGKASWNTVFSLNGYEDEPAIFNAEVSDAQMADIFAKHQAGQYLTE